MKFEMDSMSEDKVWTLSDAAHMVKPIRCKWVFKKKIYMEGKVVTYKAKSGEKVINKVNVLTMMKLVHQLLWLNPFRFS